MLAVDEAGASLFEAPFAVNVMPESFLVRGHGRFFVVCYLPGPRLPALPTVGI
jgi:hypothetical protein